MHEQHSPMENQITYWVEGSPCCNERWESAYKRFESKEEEIEKFRKRMIALGALQWNKEARIVDLFCGSGRNLICLERLGFGNLHGIDLSPRLLGQYEGPASLYSGDATDLKLPDSWADLFIVQGGFHHLPNIGVSLKKSIGEIVRVLRPGGKLVVVEPWMTPMLGMVHWCSFNTLLRRSWSKLDAFATMMEEEEETYLRWLESPGEIETILCSAFDVEFMAKRRGKFMFRGRSPKIG